MKWLYKALDLIFPPRDTERLVRAAKEDALVELISMRDMDGVTALLPYRHPLVHAAIVEAKFYGNTHAQRMLGAALHEYLLTYAEDDVLSTSVIIPIPLSAPRRRQRGYNQVEMSARYALRDLPYALAPLLTRVRDTVPQTSLSGAARRENMHGAFSACPLSETHTYIVLDDVVTTGSTLKSAEDALTSQGAEHLVLLALAY